MKLDSRQAYAAGWQLTTNSSARSTFWPLYLFVVAVYWLTIAGRPVTIWDPVGDEALFLSQALDLIKGNWLGAYNSVTLVKGPGYSIFLAISYMSGLSIGMSQGLLYLAAATYFSNVAMRLLSSRWAFFVTLIVLLVNPQMHDAVATQPVRETFYTILTLLYFGTLIDLLLLTEKNRRRLWLAVFTGLLGGVLWITREETIVIVPATLFAFAATFRFDRWRRLGDAVTAGVAGAAVIACICMLNLAYYGRFTTSEMTSGSFPEALVAVHRASYPYSRPYLPAPKEARLKIYEVSPTFAKLKPFLDPDGAPSPGDWGCRYIKSVCGDIAGGWFVWEFRNAATAIGMHSDNSTADAFYHQIAAEIRTACSDGRLVCGYWLPPMFPYIKHDQISELFQNWFRIARLVALGDPLALDGIGTELDESRRTAVLELLNHPIVSEAKSLSSFTLYGWYRREHTADWFKVSEGTGKGTVDLTRYASPDLVRGFNDPTASEQRFKMTATCNASCVLTFTDSKGAHASFTRNQTTVPSWLPIGDGVLRFDSLTEGGIGKSSLRVRLYNKWIGIMKRAQPVITAIIALGFLAFVAIGAKEVMGRTLTVVLVATTTLWIAVFTRMALFTIILTGEFPTLRPTYLAPATILALGASLIALAQVARIFLASRTWPRRRLTQGLSGGMDPQSA